MGSAGYMRIVRSSVINARRSHKCRQMQGLAWRNHERHAVGARDPGLRTDRDRATGTGFDAWCLHQAPNERARRSDAGRH